MKQKIFKKVWRKPNYYKFIGNFEEPELHMLAMPIIGIAFSIIINFILLPFFFYWLVFAWDNYYVEVKKG